MWWFEAEICVTCVVNGINGARGNWENGPQNLNSLSRTTWKEGAEEVVVGTNVQFSVDVFTDSFMSFI